MTTGALPDFKPKRNIPTDGGAEGGRAQEEEEEMEEMEQGRQTRHWGRETLWGESETEDRRSIGKGRQDKEEERKKVKGKDGKEGKWGER